MPSMEWDAEAKRRETLAARVDFGFEKAGTSEPGNMHQVPLLQTPLSPVTCMGKNTES